MFFGYPAYDRSGRSGAFPVDESPYGVRDTSGNSWDWCADRYDPEEPPSVSGRRVRPIVEPLDGLTEVKRCARGGNWASGVDASRLTRRLGGPPDVRQPMLGVRICRSLPT